MWVDRNFVIFETCAEETIDWCTDLHGSTWDFELLTSDSNYILYFYLMICGNCGLLGCSNSIQYVLKKRPYLRFDHLPAQTNTKQLQTQYGIFMFIYPSSVFTSESAVTLVYIWICLKHLTLRDQAITLKCISPSLSFFAEILPETKMFVVFIT